MRSLLTLALVFAGCQERPAPSGPPDAHPDPRVVRADPEAVNYAPTGWPLEIGDSVTIEGLRELCWAFCESQGLAVVWVVGESGMPLPFSASFAQTTDDPGIHWRDRRLVYVGHDGPRRGSWAHTVYAMEAYDKSPRTLAPPSLRAIVEGDDWSKYLLAADRAQWKAELRRGRPLDPYIRHRERYYGPDASW